MSEHYYPVSDYGPPTEDKCPHGYMWRRSSGAEWQFDNTFGFIWQPRCEWYPVPAPPTEQAPAPEPAPRWTEDRGFIKPTRGPIIESEIKAALDALNALDRDGVVWGDPRPPETAPDEMVLAHEVSGWGVCYGKTVRDSPTQFSGWYLLPKVGTDA